MILNILRRLCMTVEGFLGSTEVQDDVSEAFGKRCELWKNNSKRGY